MFVDGADFPWELLLNVVFYLDFEDFVNLKATRRELFRALGSEGLCREIVKVPARKPQCRDDEHCVAYRIHTEMHSVRQRGRSRTPEDDQLHGGSGPNL